MENFVNDYFSVEKFKKAYVREVEPIADRSFWPEVTIAAYVGAPLLKRTVGRQRKNRMKDCLEGGSGKKTDKDESEKAKKLIRRKFKCPNCGRLDHRKISPKCPLNGTKKMQVTLFLFLLCPFFISHISNSIVMCWKRKSRKNTIKRWFPKEASTSTSEHHNTPPSENVDAPYEDMGCSSPRCEKRAVLKKLTPKKNISRN
jgi:hypothetical protein